MLMSVKAENGASEDATATPNTGGRSLAGTRRHERPDESSLLEMGRRKSYLKSKDTTSLPYCQAIGREVRIIHDRERPNRLLTFSLHTYPMTISLNANTASIYS
jgi:hypothetical protein